MTARAPIPTLEYADKPPGSRLTVKVIEDSITIESNPTGLWHELRGLILGWAIILGLNVAIIFVSWRHYFPNTSLVEIASTLLSGANLTVVLQFLVAIAIVVACAMFVGRVGRTVHLDGRELVLTARAEIFGRTLRSKRRGIRREKIGSVRVARLGPGISIVSKRGKVIARLLLANRADARWVARVLRQQIGLSDRQTDE